MLTEWFTIIFSKTLKERQLEKGADEEPSASEF